MDSYTYQIRDLTQEIVYQMEEHQCSNMCWQHHFKVTQKWRFSVSTVSMDFTTENTNNYVWSVIYLMSVMCWTICCSYWIGKTITQLNCQSGMDFQFCIFCPCCTCLRSDITAVASKLCKLCNECSNVNSWLEHLRLNTGKWREEHFVNLFTHSRCLIWLK